jgi:hypothetical protein
METIAREIDPLLVKWKESSALLDVFEDKPEDIVAFIEHCSGDDLHVFCRVHGIPAEIQIFEAILNHPQIDRATVLQIFHACNPDYYEKEMAKGRDLSFFDDEEDQVFIAIIELAHNRLCSGVAMSARFRSAALIEWERFPHVSPKAFNRWRLDGPILEPTSDLDAKPMIEYRYSTIQIAFDVWRNRN